MGLLSLATFIISLLLIPFLLSLASPNYFLIHTGQMDADKCNRALLCPFLRVLKNILGAFLLLAGFAMLFLPGQGILTILLSLTLLDIPGKQRLLAFSISKPSVRHGLNWIREKTGHAPFVFH